MLFTCYISYEDDIKQKEKRTNEKEGRGKIYIKTNNLLHSQLNIHTHTHTRVTEERNKQILQRILYIVLQYDKAL